MKPSVAELKAAIDGVVRAADETPVHRIDHGNGIIEFTSLTETFFMNEETERKLRDAYRATVEWAGLKATAAVQATMNRHARRRAAALRRRG